MSTTPCFFWYPDAGGTVERLDLGEPLSDLQETPGAVAEDAYTADRQVYRVFHGLTYRVTIVLERFGSPGGSSALERKLRTLESHLMAGGAVGFARRRDRMWSSVGGSSPSRGDQLLYTAGNGFSAWAPTATLAAGDELVIETADPDARREFTALSALTGASGTQITLADPVVYTYASKPVIRHRDAWSVLRLPADGLKPFVPHDHRRNWTLQITLEYSVAEALGLWTSDYETGSQQGAAGAAWTTTLRSGAGGSGRSLEERLGRAPSRPGAGWGRP